jgi:hypothetical protein
MPVEFLMQLEQGLRFPMAAGAPQQLDLDLSGKATPASRRYYRLFNSNQLYFFGCGRWREGLVYVSTQRG